MKCPYCGFDESKVVDSRSIDDNKKIRRRRVCFNCSRKFTTYEIVEVMPFMVIKRDGRRQPFDRQKLEKGIERALEKRSVTTGTIENLVNEIEDAAIMSCKTTREISTSSLGELVLKRLYKLDKVAYIRFASAYKHFETLEEFLTEIKNAEGANQ